MAATGLLVLLDDIATVLDDVAILTKASVRKTAGVLGDDLALNAEQITGIRAQRELAVVWAVAKGSFLNKFILVPSALALSVFLPWLIIPLLMLGGLYLCFEGFEKVFHKYLHSAEEDQAAHEERVSAVANQEIDLVEFEKNKIKGAIRTDFILSAEIIVITLGVAAASSFPVRAVVVSFIALLMTVVVYGLVAGIVKMDDAGAALAAQDGKFKASLGDFILSLAPRVLTTLSIVGTAAMFLVGGGIIVHGVPLLGDWLHTIENFVGGMSRGAGIKTFLAALFYNGFVGVLAGGLAVLAFQIGNRLFGAMIKR